MKTALPPAAALLGIVLLILSAMWGSLFPPERTWNAEKSNRLSELGAEANRLQFAIVEAEQNSSSSSERELDKLRASYQEVRTEYDQLHEEFESARDGPKATGSALRWIAIVLIAVAAVTMLVNRQSD